MNNSYGATATLYSGTVVQYNTIILHDVHIRRFVPSENS